MLTSSGKCDLVYLYMGFLIKVKLYSAWDGFSISDLKKRPETVCKGSSRQPSRTLAGTDVIDGQGRGDAAPLQEGLDKL